MHCSAASSKSLRPFLAKRSPSPFPSPLSDWGCFAATSEMFSNYHRNWQATGSEMANKTIKTRDTSDASGQIEVHSPSSAATLHNYESSGSIFGLFFSPLSLSLSLYRFRAEYPRRIHYSKNSARNFNIIKARLASRRTSKFVRHYNFSRLMQQTSP